MLMKKREPTLGEKIRAWRKSVGLHQHVVSARADLSQAAWSDLENDKAGSVTLEVARRICDVTSGVITLDDFPRLRGKKVRPVPPPDSGATTIEDAQLHARTG